MSRNNEIDACSRKSFLIVFDIDQNVNNMKLFVLVAATTTLLQSASTVAFVPSKLHTSRITFQALESTATSTEKPTGTSFLPLSTEEAAKKGSPIEKIKLAKDGTAAFTDVYEFARKIREGEMTWEDVEKADLDTVRQKLFENETILSIERSKFSPFPNL